MSAARFPEENHDGWRGRFSEMDVADAKRLKAQEAVKDAQLNKILGESVQIAEITREALRI